MSLTITRCRTTADLKAFERVPEAVHSQDPFFVPPFPGSTVKLVAPKGPFSRHGEVVCFIALRGRRPVGRIAAVENRTHNAYYKDQVGFFGFFDFENDIETARALLEAARTELQGRGCTSLRGPYNPSVNDECGLLVQGFESAPMVLMPYNPPYYLDIYSALGLEGVRDLYAYYISSAGDVPQRMLKIVDRVKKKTGLSLRAFELKHRDRDLKIIQTLYNETLDRNWGFIPLAFEDMQAAAKDLMAVVDPELVMIAEKNGVPAGFSMVIPNINEFMWKAKQSPAWLRVLKFVWWLKTSRPKEARLAVLGVKPEFRNQGIGALFYVETFMKGRNKFVGGEMSWVEAGNTDMTRGIEAMGGTHYKSYRIFERLVAAV